MTGGTEPRPEPSYPRFDHVGSLLRPPELVTAWHETQAGRRTPEELRIVQDASIRNVVRMQEEAGLQIVTDGEFRRPSWSRGFVLAVGMEFKPGYIPFRDGAGRRFAAPAPYAPGKLRRTKSIVGDDYDFVASFANARPKVTLPSPSHMHFGHFSDCADRTAYPDLDEFWSDLTAIYREEIADLAARGCTHVQIDECPLALLYDEENVAIMRERGENPDALLDVYVDVLNDALRDRPSTMTVGMHMCRGNAAGFWLGNAGYDRVAERVFNDVDVDLFLLEYDSDRAGGFAPLHHVPPSKRAMLGVISTKSPAIERVDELARRIDEATKFVELDRLGVCPQCGFASAALSEFNISENPMTPAIQSAKLGLLKETARQVWDES